MINLETKNLSKNYGKARVLSNLSLSLKKGQFGCLIGPNGCGKSTFIKIAAGILKQSSGSLVVTGRLAYLPQSPSLLPWKTVENNLLLPTQFDDQLIITKTQVKKLLKKFSLDKYASKYPHQLSGGMQQKLAILRSLITEPDLLLLDEPFSALDAITKMKMHDWLLDIWAETKPAVLLVTHDMREAIYLSDKIFVLGQSSASVKKIFNIDIARPRKLDDLASAKANQYEKQLRKLLA